MTRKEQFLQAVQILAPNDALILQAAQRVQEESLPVAPGGAALELVVAIQRLRSAAGSDGFTPNTPKGAFRNKRTEDQLSLSPLALTGNDPGLLTKTDPPQRGDGLVSVSMDPEARSYRQGAYVPIRRLNTSLERKMASQRKGPFR